MTIKKYKGGYYLTFASGRREFVKSLDVPFAFLKSQLDDGDEISVVKTKTRKL